MGNPYPIQIQAGDAEGPVVYAGDLTFTDPSNQPGGAGPPIVRGPFAFAFNTAGLADGVAFYTPTIDDILLDAWIEVDTAFDGTTPSADIGQYVGMGSVGILLGGIGTGLGLQFADDTSEAPSLLANSHEYRWTVSTGALVHTGNLAFAFSGLSSFGGDALESMRLLPGKFTTADPLLLVVSQDGTKGGTAIDSTVGAGRVYIVTATPAPFA